MFQFLILKGTIIADEKERPATSPSDINFNLTSNFFNLSIISLCLGLSRIQAVISFNFSYHMLCQKRCQNVVEKSWMSLTSYASGF